MAYIPTEADVIFFRGYYPAFADTTAWPNARIMLALQVADQETGSRWGTFKPGVLNLKMRGMFAYAAYWLSADSNMTTAGGIGASTPYPASSRSVGDESVSYAVPSSSGVIGDDIIALSPYGAEFLRLRLRAGMGAACV